MIGSETGGAGGVPWVRAGPRGQAGLCEPEGCAEPRCLRTRWPVPRSGCRSKKTYSKCSEGGPSYEGSGWPTQTALMVHSALCPSRSQSPRLPRCWGPIPTWELRPHRAGLPDSPSPPRSLQSRVEERPCCQPRSILPLAPSMGPEGAPRFMASWLGPGARSAV